MNPSVERIRQRIQQCERQQMRTIAAVRNGVPRQAEPDSRRAMRRLEAEARVGQRPVAVASAMTLVEGPPADGGQERIWGPGADFVGVAFLERGVNAARTVGRVAFRDSRPQGTGFLIAPGLFITNNHVLDSEQACSEFVVEFDYEVDGSGRHREVSRFEFSPDGFFITDDRDDLDYTIVALGSRLDGPTEVEAFGHCPLSGAGNKHMLGEVANIVQHPDGRMKEVVLRENRLVSRLSHVLHYVADTEPGSSGSPVFNNQWQAIALHHWGGPWRQDRHPDGRPLPRYVNEGIRISAIVDELRDRRDELNGLHRQRLDQALDLGESTGGVPTKTTASRGPSDGLVELRSNGTAVWRVPVEIAVGVPASSPVERSPEPWPVRTRVSAPSSGSEAFKRKVDRNYENRKGYRERFLSGHRIALPMMTQSVSSRAAENLDADSGDNPFEFPYEHFSVYVDGKRGLPMMTACNIDGKNLKSINRRTGRVTRAEGLTEDPAPEAREEWYLDPRIDPLLCGDDDLYLQQVVSDGRNRLGRIFHRGHMVRRLDPCWGANRNALRAEADTFHFTNCTPQIGAFNSGNTLWQGIENHVLDNARAEGLRVTVFTGPVLDDDDPPYRQDVFPGFRVPLLFWKIAVWVDNGELSAVSMLADQSAVLREVPEGMESIGDTDEVDDFVSTVPEIERLTGLDFGERVRAADLFETVDTEGAERAGRKFVSAFSQIPLRRREAGTRPAKGQK